MANDVEGKIEGLSIGIQPENKPYPSLANYTPIPLLIDPNDLRELQARDQYLLIKKKS